MAGKPVGTIFAELALDTTSYTKSQREILASASQTALNVEKNWKIIGEKSDVMYDAMRQRIENAYQRIAHSAAATQQEIIRSKEAAAAKIKQLDEQQFGHQTSLLDSMKKNWVAASAAVVAAWMAVNKAMAWAETGAKAMQAEESFRIVSAASGESADKILADMKRAAAGTVEESDIMQKAVKGMVLGLKGDEMVHIMEAARVSARVAGEDVLTAYEGITDAIATQMPKALKRYGLITMDEMALVKRAMKEGIEDVNLYKLAMLNAAIQAEKMGQMHRNAAEDIQKFHAQIKEMKESLGKLTISVEQELMAVWKKFYGFVVGAAQGMATVLSLLPGSVGKAAKEAQVELGKWRKYVEEDIKAIRGIMSKEDETNAKEEQWGVSARISAAEKEKAAWKANLEARLGAAKLAKEIQAAEDAIAAAVAVIRARVQKNEMDAIKHNREEENRLFNEQKKNAEEYEKIVTESNDWSISEHQRAINQILSSEEKKVARMYELWDRGATGKDATGITTDQLTAGLAAIRGATAVATEAQAMKTLADTANFYSQITGYEDEYRKKQMEWIDKEAKRRAELYKDEVAAAKWAAEEKGKLEQALFEKKTSEVHKGLGDMAAVFTAISSMYDKNSAEYARMQEAAKAMIVLQQAVAVANAVAAIANQGLGDPYSAFARIAAMTAAMGSLLASVGMSFGGGGAAAAPTLPASTVLGAEAGTGSESASKAYELLKDTYTLEYRELTGIHDSMKELNRNITGLVTSIVRTGGVGGFTSAPGGTTGVGGNWGTNTVGFLNAMTFGPSVFSQFTSIIMSPLWEKVSGWLGGFGNSVMDRIFGGGTSSSVTSAGIQFRGASVGNLLAGRGMGAQQYADIATEHETALWKPNWTSYETRYAALDAQVSDMLDSVFQDLGKTLVELAKGFGTDTAAAMAYVFAETKIDLQGKSTEDISKAISEYISNTADTAVESLFGSMLRGYQQLNEGLFETAVRLIRDKAVIVDTLEMTGQAFRGSTSQVIAFSEAIIAMAGDLDTLRKSADTYYDKFFTDAEKQARLQGQLSGALGDMGMALPGSRGGYRALVEGLNLTTTSGQQAYVTLLRLSEAADQYYSALEDVGRSQEALTKSLREQSEMIRNWISDLSRSSLAPVTSMEGWRLEYDRQKALVSGAGATSQDVSGYLNYAKEYLSFMRTYGGDYQAIYASVVGDVQKLGEMKDAALQQLDAIGAADIAAREAARIAQEQRNELARLIAGIPPGQTARTMGGGGLTSGLTIAGELGPDKREWVVPTYEPQRSRFLESAPPQFWENLRGGGVVQGGGGDITVRSVVILDSKVVGESVAKQIPRNANLAEAIRRVN